MKYSTLHHLIKYAVLSLTLCLSVAISAYSSTQPIKPDFNNALTITDSKSNFSIVEGYGYISCIGTIKNTSDYTWEDLVIEVQYFNSNNELIDTSTDHNYDLVVPANDEVTFRVSDDADKNGNDYHSHKVRITSASTVSACNTSTSNKNKAFIEILISWTPMLLLIAVWIFFMRKYQGRNSPQKQIIQIQERQYALIEEQNKLFQKLIEAIEKK